MEDQKVLLNFLRKRSFNEITNSDLEIRLIKSVKSYRLNKSKMQNKIDFDLLNNSNREIKDLIEFNFNILI